MKNKIHFSDSFVQNKIEKIVLEKLHLHPAKNVKFFGSRVDIDGMDEHGFYEVYAHVGDLKIGGKRKVITDAVKLFLAARHNKKKNKTIVFIDKSVQKLFTKGNAWHVKALRELGIKTKVQIVPEELREKVREAQERQGKGIIKK